MCASFFDRRVIASIRRYSHQLSDGGVALSRASTVKVVLEIAKSVGFKITRALPSEMWQDVELVQHRLVCNGLELYRVGVVHVVVGRVGLPACYDWDRVRAGLAVPIPAAPAPAPAPVPLPPAPALEDAGHGGAAAEDDRFAHLDREGAIQALARATDRADEEKA
eukprot:319474-Pyramimonas_sp.AAC.1